MASKQSIPSNVFIARTDYPILLENFRTRLVMYLAEKVNENRSYYCMAFKSLSDIKTITRYNYNLLIVSTESGEEYVCYGKDSFHDYGIIEKIPRLRRKIKVYRTKEVNGYHYLKCTTIRPEEIDEKYSEFGIYILKTENKVYLCKKG